MSQAEVIWAFLDGQCMAEPPLSTDGARLYFEDAMIACNRDGNLSTVSAETGCADENLGELVMDFAEWRKRRQRVLRSVTGGMQAWMGLRAFAEVSDPLRCQSQTRKREAS